MKSRKMSKEDFIKKAKEVHGDRYDYSKIIYNGTKEKIEIICKIHGCFWQKAENHIYYGQGCKKCSYEHRGAGKNCNSLRKWKSLEDFIKKAKEVHGDRYDYSKILLYNKKNKKIEIVCSKHGSFWQSIASHISGSGCPKCNGGVKYLTTEIVINKLKKVHGDRYDYSKLIYNGAEEKIEIICHKHGSFFQKYSNHLYGYGCPMCRNSLGENKIYTLLTKNNISFTMEKNIGDLKSDITGRKLLFDFYIQEKNICIEFNGSQHYMKHSFMGGEKEFIRRKHNDEKKKNFCLKNNIKLITIPYFEIDNIKEILLREGIFE